MTRAFAPLDAVERRVLGALRCVDATTRSPIDDPLVIEAGGARLTRNRSGLYVIRSWSRVAAHEDTFHQPPSSPAIGSAPLTVDVHDPNGRYVARRVVIDLPRDPNPNGVGADSILRAVDVPMYPAASAPLGANWVELRVTASDAGNGDALGGALLRVVAGDRVLARGVTDWRGEALVPVAGVPVTTWSTDSDAVVVSEIAAALECYFDPASGTRTAPARVAAGLPPSGSRLPNPDTIESARNVLPRTSTPVMLAAGRALAVSITVVVP